jgi:hypothetical protein
MQPLGLLGALLGGYQQGRLTKQNREVKAAQLLRQQQENEALKKYREDSLELQRRRLAATEDPVTKARRDHFYKVIGAIRPDINSRTDKLFRSAQTVDELNSGLEGIHREFAPRIKGLRGIYDSSGLQDIGSFDDLIYSEVPDWVRSEKFDPNMAPKPDLDMATFDKQIANAYTNLSNRGITDPALQEQEIAAVVNSHAARTGRSPESLWKYVSGIRPNQPVQNTTYQAVTGPLTPTTMMDPSLGAFETKQDAAGQSTTEYSHAMPPGMTGLTAFKGLLKDRHGVGQGTSEQLADEMMIDDIVTMFKLPQIAQKYGLNNIEDPVQFKRALEMYFNPNILNEFRGAVNRSQNFGIGADGQQIPFYSNDPYGDFSQSSFGKGLAGIIQQQPLNAQTTTYKPITYNDVTRIPLDIQDRNALLQGDKIRQDVNNAVTSGELNASRLRVARATEWAKISEADLDLQLKALKVVLDPLKYKLAVANFNLDDWYKKNQIGISGKRASADWNRMLIDVGKPLGQLLTSADNEVKSSGMNLTTLLSQNTLASAVFQANPALAQKISSGQELTPEDIKSIQGNQALMTNQAVRLATERYTAALNERSAAKSAMLALKQQSMALSNLKEPVVTGNAPGSYFSDPWEEPPGVDDKTPAPTTPTPGAGGKVTPPASRPTKPATTPAPPPNTSKVQTNPKIITGAQEKFKNKGKGGKKPETTTPPKNAGKPATKVVVPKDDWGDPP